LGKFWPVLSLTLGKHSYVILVESFSDNLQSTLIVIAIRINTARKTTEQKKQTSRTSTRKGREEVTAEERIQKANGSGWNWKQWRWEDRVGRSVKIGACN
jgi:hypothetical protein